MTILFITPDVPLTPDGFGGASALAYGHLELLAHTGHTLVGLRIAGWGEADEWAHYYDAQTTVWERVRRWVPVWFEVDDPRSPDAGRWRRLVDALLDAEAPTRDSVDAATADAIEDVVARVQPDLIWAEHWRPAAVAVYAGVDVPVVYSHHDWRWRLAEVKAEHGASEGSTWRDRYRIFRVRRAEEALVQRVAACVSGSVREVEQMQALDARRVGYFPTTRRPTSVMRVANGQDTAPRIVHLGSMQATASREGLRRFLDVVWPQLEEQSGAPPSFWQIGSMDAAAPELQHQIDAQGGRCTGYVQDLTTVLRPYDLHVIPWEHDTGTRTRAPIAFDRRQVVVATRAAMACMPEARDGENCVLVDDLDEMASVLHALYHDSARRQCLGDAARQTFLDAFTREAMQPRFDRFLANCLSTAVPFLERVGDPEDSE
ncbi:MAG: glycosyltransferase [Bacteroidetes bacterium]|jgi:glycosyltransferase involved in cell wall biosynthesis|nr:glycosyltransferase [Bacteroidota bacterium]